MVDLNKILRDQFEDFYITPQHLGQIKRMVYYRLIY